MGLFDFEGDAKIFSKAQSPLRWIILVLACVMMIGNYYCYDNPAALKTQIEAQMGNPSDYETMFSLLYTVYSIPNVILPFFGGYFVDKLGVRMCLVVFSAFILAGQIVFAIGLSAKSWPIMFIGRVIYGFGGESLGVANSALLAQWFAGKELAFAFGLNLSIARLGSVINNLVSPQVSNSSGVVFALWFGAIICGISFFCTTLVIPVDKGLDIVLKKSERLRAPLLNNPVENDELSENREDSLNGLNSVKGKNMSQDNDDTSDSGVNNDINIYAVKDFIRPFWVLTLSCVVVYGCVLPFNNIASSLLLERDYFMEQPSGCALTPFPNGCQLGENVPNEFCKTGQWYQPPIAPGKNPNCDNDPDNCYTDYCHGQSHAEIQATTVMSIPYIISACLSPILGGFVDRFGMRAVIATLAPAALAIVHGLLGYSKVSPVGPLVGQGLAYSGFAAVLWPSIPLVVEPKYIGLGYGFVTAVQNIGLACFPLIIAQIYTDSGEHYIPQVELFFMCLAFGGILVGLYLNYYDYNNNNLFNGVGDDYEAIDVDDEEAGDTIEPLRTRSIDDHGRIQGAGGAGAHHPSTFTAHEEIHRARVVSGEITASGRTISRTNSRGPSHGAQSGDAARLQATYGRLSGHNAKDITSPMHGQGRASRNSRHSSSEILATR